MEIERQRILNKIKENFKNISQTKILICSFLFSSFVSYKYLKNRSLYSEYHGHFNSPQNMLNKRLTKFHLQDALFRFTFTFILMFGSFYSLKYYLNDYYYNSNKDQTKNTLNVDYTQDNEYIVKKGNKKLLEFYDRNEIENSARFSNEEELKRRDNINKYKSK